ncbi:helix-turn-helix domain-containing protein [Candidatus Neomarinimicrobiota bacterium]
MKRIDEAMRRKGISAREDEKGKKSEEREKYMSIKSAAKLFDMSEEGIRGMIKRREIPFYKMGRRVRILYKDVEECLERYPSKDEVSIVEPTLDWHDFGS